MSQRAARQQHAGLIEGARAFVLLTVTISITWSREAEALGGLFCLAALWVLAGWVQRSRIPGWVLCLGESALVGLLAALFLDASSALLAALAIPPFVHGLLRGFRGIGEALLAQGVTFVLVAWGVGPVPTLPQSTDVFTWLVTGLGLGLVASFFVADAAAADDGTAAYREARLLITELNDLSAKLQGGLDPTSMGGAILEQVTAELPCEVVALHVQRDSILLPLVTRSSHEELEADEGGELARAVWEDGHPRVLGRRFGFPVSTSGSPIAVVTGRLSAESAAGGQEVVVRLRSLADRLAPDALRLDTAQLFTAFRDAAMSDERRRLAREMHDGVAQDIASMGYVVDALVSTAPGPAEEKALLQLRTMISSVVAEVRRSVMTLRTQAGSSESLGAAIATLARHLSDVSGIPIKVTVDERTSRLRHEVEAELLRIAQEAMNNAVKHSRAGLIDVHCRVQAPSAQIVVSDDGRGLQGGRRDSHGLSIMKERAALIGGVLEVRSSPTRGTVVSVRVGAPLENPTPQPTFTDHRSAKVS
ncbi:sensor histidine kinase [Nocardioides campestrisoli]|uniref:sensor histidine kinase n=1 Tax=Nocardioides campestrisoli TaxID=2736757 RepID=UPI0015E65F9B|nr:sensor histidine kinase [Nocardioides campestrisoli]